ncbi:hypothetical protein TVAG_246840 [Trichomonas vaginalis G3]|uniref:Uncharacterized protein n=1 Tax=Trichomonas vaginalis (strain ATCC PRA-98 / G3) TaxID=412133 RepID=A2DKM3_TRIV3|nr:protein of unknown function, DUF1619 family [Trichomonas vaginalis G3]EAY19006.1 hypothetical protein TVAG_246840 [Trichomonas vaginalis G3]KAI5521201.1 protein of unknown function, DUF1619 family [Trichomonas vaginalis G3]|eukprot:XP_001579992.1 hypothetical protein [Trichomonas vaginalis G3]
MIIPILGLRRVRSYITYDDNNGTTSYESNSNYSTLQKGDVSDCPCQTNNYTCIPDCCCAPKCASFYNASTYTQCYSAPTADIVTRCDSFSKDSVGSVSDWLKRVIFCVYRENNPLTNRGIIYSVPYSKYRNTALNYTVQSKASSAVTSFGYLTEDDVTTVTGADKSNRGYLFGQSILNADGELFTINASSGSVSIPLEFGVNSDFEFNIPNGTNPNATISLLDSTGNHTIRIMPNNTQTIDFSVNSTDVAATSFLGLTISILYKATDYKPAPQYIIDSAIVNTTTSDFPEGIHAGLINGTHVVGHIGFFELPNSENFLDTSSEADEDSWLPFNWKGVNNS